VDTDYLGGLVSLIIVIQIVKHLKMENVYNVMVDITIKNKGKFVKFIQRIVPATIQMVIAPSAMGVIMSKMGNVT